MNYYSKIDHVAAQIGKVSHMLAQFTQSDTIAGMISKANTFMQSAIGLFDSYIANAPILCSISGDPIFENLNPRCGLMKSLQRVISTVSLQNQLLPVVSGDVSGMEIDPLEPALYYYHPDHLGSATWITDSLGNPAQFLQYLPYGELWRNQKLTGYDERYKYTGKERDDETGYDYFGARHYTSALSWWLSPDPLMDNYPEISPYAYCNWNPLKFVDPDGKKITIAPNGLFERIAQRFGFSVGYVKKVQQDLEYLKTVNPTTRGMVEQLENSDNEHIIRFPQKKWNNSKPFCSEDFNNHKGQGSVVDYDPDNWKSKNGDKRNPRAGLGHELRHSLDIDKGTGTLESENGIPLMEVDAINTENQVRQQTGDAKRTTYGGKEIPSNLLD